MTLFSPAGTCRNRIQPTWFSIHGAALQLACMIAICSATAASAQSPPRAVLPGVNADPHIAFFGDRCYLYPTTDGSEGWRSRSFRAWSSDNLVDWRDEGVILDLPRDLAWADIHAWAPAIATKHGKYFYYYSADKNIGVAVAEKPTGPFRDPLGKPLVAATDYRGMQCIDPMVFIDDNGDAYLYWGQGRCKVVKLHDDMISYDSADIRDITPPGYNEGAFVYKRKGIYYLSWSEFDTRDPRYSVAYGVSSSPLGPFEKASSNPILQQRDAVKGAGHHSIANIPGTDRWVIAYHRFRIPDGDGYRRETCLSPLRHNDDGTIAKVDVYEGVEATKLAVAQAAPPREEGHAIVEIKTADVGKSISPHLIGVFFEDLNSAADGGLYAELVQNRSFEYSKADRANWHSLSGWQLVAREAGAGEVVVESTDALHTNNPHYAVLDVRTPAGDVGLANSGFQGIAVEAGKRYDFSYFAKQLAGESKSVEVRLETPEGRLLAATTLPAPVEKWQKYEAVLTPLLDESRANLIVICRGVGRVALDMVSLFPQDTYKRRRNGLRKDLAEAIAGLKPKFVRFPGGCLVHGNGLGNMYRWQDSVGPVHERKGQPNIWQYHQSLGLGYFEYFQFCEDIGAKPIPVVPAAVCCQNSGALVTGKWGEGQRALPLDEMPAYIEEVLALVEFANGDVGTQWGRLRAEAGHPEPFGLEYIGVGNEDHITPDFQQRFQMIHNAMAEAHPEITVIGTVGPFSDGEDFERGWDFARALGLAMVDEHYYKSPDWFLQNLKRYDAYDRAGPAVYLGEYAAHDERRQTTLRSALAEAAYLTHLERNADIVHLASYAPLLGKAGHTQWDPNLIYFDNQSVCPTINYYVQQLFSANSGDIHLPCEADLPISVVRDSTTGDLIIKVVNAHSNDHSIRLAFDSVDSFTPLAICTTLTGPPLAVNRLGHSVHIGPSESTIAVAEQFDLRLPANSLVVVRLTAEASD
jgi:alpha-L-arabinofuranosidase